MQPFSKKNNRGEIVTVVLIVLGLFGGSMLAGFRPLDLFRKKPDTAQLTKLQADLAASQAAEAKARADAVQLQKDKDAAIMAERTKYNDQLRSAQQASVGAEYILGKVANPSPEVALGRSMVARTNLRFAVALGALPKDQQDDIVQMMEGIIAQRDEAVAKLAETDKKFTQLTGEHSATVQTLAMTSNQLVTANQKVETMAVETGKVQGQVTAATNRVKVIAQDLSDEKSASGSLSSAFTRLLWISVVTVIGLSALWIYSKLRSVGPGTLGKIMADIRAGVDPVHAFDTYINASLHPAIKKAANAVSP